MIRKTIFIFFLVLCLNLAYSIEIKGVGYGKDEIEAKLFALNDLSSQIEVEVSSQFSQIMTEFSKTGNSSSQEFTESIVKTKSGLPIIGVKYNVLKINDKNFKYKTESILDSKTSLNSYEAKLSSLKEEIQKLNNILNQKQTSAEKIETLNLLFSKIYSFNKYKIVTIFLGSTNIPKLDTSDGEIKSKILELENAIDTIDMGAKKLTAGIDKTNVYIFPPSAKQASGITQFGSAIKDYVSKYIKTTDNVYYADFFLKGNYNILKDHIEVIYNLTDKDNNVLMTKIVKFLPKSYQNYEYEPKSPDFDTLLTDGYVVSNDFKIEISTNKGKSNLLFKQGEEVEIFVKINRPGFFYIVGHVVKDTDKYSYLLEIGSGADNLKRNFIRYVNADDTNKWLSLGQFSVEPPFGIESLQVIAAKDDLIDKIPSFTYDNDMGYYVVSKNPKEAVTKTRALKPIKNNEVISSEAVLLMTTFDK